MSSGLTDRQRAVLEALCDTFVPAVERDDDPTGTWALRASDLLVPPALELLLHSRLSAGELAGVGALLDALGQLGLVEAPAAEREALVQATMASSPEAAAGLEGCARARSRLPTRCRARRGRTRSGATSATRAGRSPAPTATSRCWPGTRSAAAPR